MKIGIDFGHTLRGANYGAVGIRPESELTREVGRKVIEKLQKLGHEVVICSCDEATTNSESLAYRVNTANNNNVDLYFSIHFNCSYGQGQGVEVYAMSSKGREYAQKIVDTIAGLGFTNRGVKDGSRLYVVHNTNAPACLIECCFCDNQEDMTLYNPDSMSDAIVLGIAGELPKVEEVKPVPQPVIEAPKPQANPRVKLIQELCNILRCTDYEGNPLVVDGILGKRTLSAVEKLPTIKINTNCDQAARVIQEIVGVRVDGAFGPKTLAAVKAYQSNNGLVDDGIVGQKTWHKFLEV